jgi:hypothetical protein
MNLQKLGSDQGTERIEVLLLSSLVKEAQELATTLGVTRSDVLRGAIRAGLHRLRGSTPENISGGRPPIEDECNDFRQWLMVYYGYSPRSATVVASMVRGAKKRELFDHDWCEDHPTASTRANRRSVLRKWEEFCDAQ